MTICGSMTETACFAASRLMNEPQGEGAWASGIWSAATPAARSSARHRAWSSDSFASSVMPSLQARARLRRRTGSSLLISSTRPRPDACTRTTPPVRTIKASATPTAMLSCRIPRT